MTTVGSSGFVFVQGGAAQSNLIPVSQPGVQSPGNLVAAGTGSGLTDYDLSVLATGFGNKLSKIDALRDHLKLNLTDLLGRGFSADRITTLLVDAAKAYLTSQGFGFLINDAIEPILRKLVGQVIRDQPGTPTEPEEPTLPTGKIGTQTFTISGTVTLTPTGTKTKPKKPPVGPKKPPIDPKKTTMPDDLTPTDGSDDDSAAPPPTEP